MPKRCYGCGTLVETNGIGPMGMPLLADRRLMPNEHVISPMLCWDCRGAALLQMRQMEHLCVPMPGLLGEMGMRSAGRPSPGTFPIFRFLHNCD